MERLTDKILTEACNDPWDYCGLDAHCTRHCTQPTPCKIPALVHRLAKIENILGDTYDLGRLRELVEENKKSRARKCPKCGKMNMYPRIDWKYFYCYSCETTFPAEEIIRSKAALAKEDYHE